MQKSVMINPKLMDSEEYDKNHIAECAECLMEAEEIKKDPVLMKAIEKHLADKKDKITSLSQLREKANNYSEDSKDEE